MSIPSGTRLGSYEILSMLGSGGMGAVYRAYDSKLQRTVAVKILSEEAGEDGRRLLLQEARAASALSHPHICVIYEVGEADGRAFIAMEYVDGKPLSEMIPAQGLPVETVLRYGTQIAEALTHAHDRGVIHRDLKSSNIIVSREGLAKVVDFGLARRFAFSAPDMPTSSNVLETDSGLAGTISYMAPELLLGDPPTVASDLWALGVLLYEMSSGHLPFTGRTSFELTAAVLRGGVPPLSAAVPSGIRMIIALCLAREPAARYRSAGEVRAALLAVRSDSVRDLSIASAPRRVSAALLWGLTALLLGSVGIGALLLSRRGTDSAALPRPAASGRLVLLVGSDRRAFDPALSPDGKMIAYVGEDDDGRLNLFAGRTAGGGRVRLTSEEAVEEHPRFSPDGERILFTRRRPGAAPELCIVPALGGDVVVALTNAVDGAWSGDGTRIAFIQADSAGKRIALVTARADGSDRRTLLPSDGVYPFLRNPAWSPDGMTLAIVRGTGGVAAEIWLLSRDGSGLRRLSGDRAAVFSDEPVFTADGRGIVHASNRGGATNIWSLPIDGGEPSRLTTGPGPEATPTVARDGAIAFASSRWKTALFLHDLASRKSQTLVTHSSYLWGPTFSPNGRELAFSRNEVDGAWHVWLVPADGGAGRQLTSGAQGEVYPRYTRDGESVVYHTWDKPRRVWRVARRGGPPDALTPDGLDATFGDLSPDGTTLAFVATEDKEVERVYTLRVGEAKPRLLRSPASMPRWSPDGTWIAFSPDRSYSGGVFIVHPDGTGERRLTQTGGWPIWWPDGKRIGYRTVTGDATQQIESVTPDGLPAAPIEFRFENANNPFEISPDGRAMATTNAVHVSDEIWLMQAP
jgi:eukaryotic-like serine/threonine-protein kinase